MGTATMGRKKTGTTRTSVVKIETELARKAKTIAQDQGKTTAEYLSDIIRGGVDRDWPKVLKKIVGERELGK